LVLAATGAYQLFLVRLLKNSPCGSKVISMWKVTFRHLLSPFERSSSFLPKKLLTKTEDSAIGFISNRLLNSLVGHPSYLARRWIVWDR
jgi:hypothetical protein